MAVETIEAGLLKGCERWIEQTQPSRVERERACLMITRKMVIGGIHTPHHMRERYLVDREAGEVVSFDTAPLSDALLKAWVAAIEDGTVIRPIARWVEQKKPSRVECQQFRIERERLGIAIVDKLLGVDEHIFTTLSRRDRADRPSFNLDTMKPVPPPSGYKPKRAYDPEVLPEHLQWDSTPLRPKRWHPPGCAHLHGWAEEHGRRTTSNFQYDILPAHTRSRFTGYLVVYAAHMDTSKIGTVFANHLPTLDEAKRIAEADYSKRRGERIRDQALGG